MHFTDQFIGANHIFHSKAVANDFCTTNETNEIKITPKYRIHSTNMKPQLEIKPQFFAITFQSITVLKIRTADLNVRFKIGITIKTQSMLQPQNITNIEKCGVQMLR